MSLLAEQYHSIQYSPLLADLKNQAKFLIKKLLTNINNYLHVHQQIIQFYLLTTENFALKF